ncbi:MAG: EAL domain-containing protein [Lachnospiraceae bacterium]|nr:EAL domain-containing protein [Lachnospiraceae bacterium]
MVITYVYQFDVAAIIAMALLIFLCRIHRNYVTRGYKLFMALNYATIISALTDLATIFVLDYPLDYSRFYIYFINILYYLSFNIMGPLFYLYMDDHTRIPGMKKISLWLGYGYLAIVVALIVTTPWTHFVFYFDELGGYHHGSLIWLLYAVPLTLVSIGLVMMQMTRYKFNQYQVLACVIYFIAMILCLLVQIRFPKLLLNSFGCSLVMYFVYAAFENPAYFCYKSTNCLNREAFMDTIHNYHLTHESFTVTAFNIQDFDYLQSAIGNVRMGNCMERIAEGMSSQYKQMTYVISHDTFAVITLEEGMAPTVEYDIRELLKIPMVLDNSSVYIRPIICSIKFDSLSFGSAEVEEIIHYHLNHPNHSHDVEELIRDAMNEKQMRERLLYTIRESIEKASFEVFYQPIYNVALDRYTSAEALVRMKDDRGKYITPELFIPIAEKYGYVETIGDMVLEKVCQFIAQEGCMSMGVEYIEVNLSPVQCMDANLAEHVKSILNKYKVDPKYLNLEITETAQIENSNTILQNLLELKELGMNFSIDDYGSGFASADYLIKLPVSIVKIDKGILWNAMVDDQAMIVLENTMRMIKELHQEIVVEGVESREMMNVLKRNQCDFMQGFLFSEPISEDEFIRFLQLNNP